MGATSLAVLHLLVAVSGTNWPDEYDELDALLRQYSPKYKSMADAVQARQPYRIASTDDFPLGNVRSDGAELVIELNPRVPKNRRVTVLIWEMANAFQRDKFDEIHRRAVDGQIASSREYGIRMEMVEHGSHQHHLDVLRDLSRAGFRISEDFLYLLGPDGKTLDDYRIPSAHDYLDANAASGHTKHYEDWYGRITRKSAGAQ